jgi:hypothetical protein
MAFYFLIGRRVLHETSAMVWERLHREGPETQRRTDRGILVAVRKHPLLFFPPDYRLMDSPPLPDQPLKNHIVGCIGGRQPADR